MPFFFTLFAVLLALPVLFPHIDLWASGLFYRAGEGFFLADNPILTTLHWVASSGAWRLGFAFAVMAGIALWRRKPFAGLDAKAWVFLLLALIIGPGLIANAGFKDHWGRARPREVVEFGGIAQFSPALVPQSDRRPNGSFVSGDGAFGFFLPAFAYVVSRRYARRAFWSLMGAGCLFAATRLVMGAHFLSDNLFAALFMLLSVAAVHAVMYGRAETIARWKLFFSRGQWGHNKG